MSKSAVDHLKKEGLHKEGDSMKVDPKELAFGIKMEMEHTSSKAVAREIALDHLHEDSKYYTHLADVEEEIVKKSIDLMKSKYISRKKGPTGKWVYTYDLKGTGRGKKSLVKEPTDFKAFIESNSNYFSPMSKEMVNGIVTELGYEINDVLDGRDSDHKWLSLIVNAYGVDNTKKIMRAGFRKHNKSVKADTGYSAKQMSGISEAWAVKQVDATVNKIKKSFTEGDMKESRFALIIIPGEIEPLEKSTQHPAGVSAPGGKTKSKIPYEGHAERMKFAKMAAQRMIGSSTPEDEGDHADNKRVDGKGRVKGEKKPYTKYSKTVSGSGSQAHDNFGRRTIIVRPEDIGSSAPESASKHQPPKVRNPKK